jgi:hypothetical protein
LRAGRLPLWNPYAGCGVPLLANHQTAVFYPPNLIYLILPVERAMGVSLAVHALLAGLAMYAFTRDLGRSRLAGLVAASAFALSGYVVARGSFLTEIAAIAWLPLLWLYGRRLVMPGRAWRLRLRACIALAVVIALQFLAGHAQTWFYSLISLGLYGCWLVGTGLARRPTVAVGLVPTQPNGLKNLPQQADPLRVQSSPWRCVFRAIRSILLPYLWLGAALAWGVSLAAIQFLPTLELSRLAQRSTSENWEAFALQYSMWPWRLITLLLPDFFGNPARGNYWGYATYWEDAGHIGVLPFALALLAVLTSIRRRLRCVQPTDVAPETAPMAFLAVIGLLMALGKNTSFYLFFFRRVPGFAQFQAPARWLGVYTTSMAVLAAVGLDALRPSRALTVAGRLAMVGGLQATLLAWLATTERARAWLAGAGLPDVQTTFASALLRFSLLATATLLLLLWQQRLLRNSPATALSRRAQLDALAWSAAVLLLVAADLIAAGFGLNPAIDVTLYAQQTETGAALVADVLQGRVYYSAQSRDEVLFGRYLDFGDYRSDLRGAERLAYWQGLREALVPDLAMVEGLSSANTFEPLVETRYRTLLEALEDADPLVAQRTLGLMNVAYLMEPTLPDKTRIVHSSPSVTVYRNPNLRPRAYVAHQAQVAHSPEHALSLLLSPTFEPATVVVEKPPVVELPAAGLPDPDPARPSIPQLPNRPNQVTIRVTLTQPGYLVLMDTAYPGWRATVDGQAAAIERANYAFRAIALEAGAHEVVFYYRPRSLIAGTVASGAAWLAALVTLAVLGWGKEQH